MLNKINIHYKKNNNSEIFRYFNKTDKNKITKIQNYVPIYKNFFKLNSKNFNLINLNQKYSIKKIKLKDKENNNKFLISVESEKNTKTIHSFFKWSPLLDPTKYMGGKYKDLSFNENNYMPDLSNNTMFERINCLDNCSYVDGFFSYLSSRLLHKFNFVHGIDFYGSFLGIKEKFKVDITDDLEYLYDYDFFHENNNKLFTTDKINEELLDDDTRKNRKSIEIIDDIELSIEKLDNKIFKNNFKQLTTENLKEFDKQVRLNDLKLLEKDTDYERIIDTKEVAEKTNSECSSRISDTSDEESENDESSSNNDKKSKEHENSSYDGSEEDDSDSEISSIDSNYNVYADVFNFPCQIICLEKLDNTLDICTEEEEYKLNDHEWISCFFQIVMTLLTYEKAFDFTHNDLHTNNIMYVKTDKKYLNYCYNGLYYQVPTYGKIYKIIDFGRAIYKFGGKQICSDSFYPKGDAAGQFNFHVFKNERKKEIKPNNGFDLCRLACSLYDYFFDDYTEKKNTDVEKVIQDWIKDDSGKNILYKSNGEERYPDFKLYKMITRKCSKETPKNQLNKVIFKKFITSKKKLGKKAKIMNIDKIPQMF